MADTHLLFTTFHDRIALSPAEKACLATYREDVRHQIRNFFRDRLQAPVPRFRSQGAYAMDTLVQPIDAEHDLDDGVYLQHLETIKETEWPSADTVHHWIAAAVEGHTSETPVVKGTHVRVRDPGHYHVDLPAYGQLNGTCRLAQKGALRWPHRDPLALIAWFESHAHLHGTQLRRMVRYLKAWADFQSRRHGKMPGGLILTVLATSCFQASARDDLALAGTLAKIDEAVRTVMLVLNPVDFQEVISEQLTVRQKKRFRNAVQMAAGYACKAVDMDDTLKASKLWRNQFGDRFPLADKRPRQESRRQTAMAIAALKAESNPPIPWGWR